MTVSESWEATTWQNEAAVALLRAAMIVGSVVALACSGSTEHGAQGDGGAGAGGAGGSEAGAADARDAAEGDAANGVCAPGEARSCDPGGACFGAETCSSDGSGFGACGCKQCSVELDPTACEWGELTGPTGRLVNLNYGGVAYRMAASDPDQELFRHLSDADCGNEHGWVATVSGGLRLCPATCTLFANQPPELLVVKVGCPT